MIQQLKSKYEMRDVVCKGCSVNRREPESGSFVQAGWRFLTTQARLAQSLDLPCRCPRTYQHARSSGVTRGSEELYTPELTKRVVKYLLEELRHQDVTQEVLGRTLPRLLVLASSVSVLS